MAFPLERHGCPDFFMAFPLERHGCPDFPLTFSPLERHGWRDMGVLAFVVWRDMGVLAFVLAFGGFCQLIAHPEKAMFKAETG